MISIAERETERESEREKREIECKERE